MADSFVFANRAVSVLQSAIGQFDTQIYIGADDVYRFPTLVAGAKFPIILSSREDDFEICYATALTETGEMTVERAREGTEAQNWSAGTYVEHTFTAGSFLAAARLVPQGVWNAAANYAPGDVVEYTDISYIATQASINQVPSGASAYWQTLYQPPGISSTALTWSGDWNSGTTYALGAYVKYQGRLFVAVAAGAAHLPTDPAYWYALGVPPDPTFYDAPLTATGTNNYTVTPSPAPTALYEGMTLTAVFGNINSTAATLTVGALAPVPLRPKKGTEFAAGELATNAVFSFVYFAGSNEFVARTGPAFEKRIADAVALNTAQDARLTAIENYLKYVPIGAGMDFWGAAAQVPPGWLLCYGQAVSRTTYAALFLAIGTLHGVGNGTTTFNLPDARGRGTVGLDNMGGTAAGRLTGYTTVGFAGGLQTHTLTIAQLPALQFTAASHSHPYTVRNELITVGADTGNSITNIWRGTSTNNGNTGGNDALTNSLGGGGSHPIVQPSIAANKIIFAGV